MNKPSDSAGRGRYRFQGGKPVDPAAGVHPEMAADQADAPQGLGIPNTPEELIAMQENKPERPEKPDQEQSAKAKQVLELIEKLDISAAEDQQIALTLVRRARELPRRGHRLDERRRRGQALPDRQLGCRCRSALPRPDAAGER